MFCELEFILFMKAWRGPWLSWFSIFLLSGFQESHFLLLRFKSPRHQHYFCLPLPVIPKIRFLNCLEIVWMWGRGWMHCYWLNFSGKRYISKLYILGQQWLINDFEIWDLEHLKFRVVCSLADLFSGYGISLGCDEESYREKDWLNWHPNSNSLGTSCLRLNINCGNHLVQAEILRKTH